MIDFSYSLIPVGFKAILMTFLSFLSQKTYPGEFLRAEVILSRSYLGNCCNWLPTPLSLSICYCLKMPYILKRLQLESNIFRIFISLWYLPLVKISKKSMRQGWHVLDNLTWNYPVKHLFLLVTITMITVKMSFTHSHNSSCHQNHAIY